MFSNAFLTAKKYLFNGKSVQKLLTTVIFYIFNVLYEKNKNYVEIFVF